MGEVSIVHEFGAVEDGNTGSAKYWRLLQKRSVRFFFTSYLKIKLINVIKAQLNSSFNGLQIKKYIFKICGSYNEKVTRKQIVMTIISKYFLILWDHDKLRLWTFKTTKTSSFLRINRHKGFQSGIILRGVLTSRFFTELFLLSKSNWIFLSGIITHNFIG